MRTVDEDCLTAALGYAARGWHVIALWWGEDGICACSAGAACASPGKHPVAFVGKRAICPQGLHSATVDPELLQQWWARVPDANVGIVTGAISGLDILDSDPRHGGDESLHALAASLPNGLPDTIHSLTGNGGEHLLFAHPGGRISNKQGQDWGLPGLDVRGDGGYFVAPPSLHVSGRRYSWDVGAHPDTHEPASMPPALAARLRSDGIAASGSRLVVVGETDISSILAGVPEGERGTALFRLAAKLRRVDTPYPAARELVLRAARAARPPYNEHAAVKHLDSAYGRYAPSDVAAAEVEEAGVVTQRFRWWTLDEMEHQPPPAWLVDEMLTTSGFAMLVGRERSLKSFVAIDLGMSVAAGIPWQGHKVKQGPVGYVFAEGRGGIGKRTKAWRIARKVTSLDCFRVLPQAVQMMEAKDVDELLASILTWKEMPILLIIDTLARCFVGGDENSSKEIGLFIAACDRLQQATGATVLIVHHGRRTDGESRGSGALLAALDTHIRTIRDDNTVTLKCEKQKDFDEFDLIHLTARMVGLPDGDTSLVMERAVLSVEAMERTERATLDAIVALGGTVTSDGAWKAAARGRSVSERSYYRAKKRLLDAGLVRETDGKFTAAEAQP